MNTFDIVLGLLLALALGFLAARKHRSAWEWTAASFPLLVLFGMEAFVPLLLLLLWIKAKCPKCLHLVSHQEIRRRRCPHCDYQGRIGIIDPHWLHLFPNPFTAPRRRLALRPQSRRRGRS